MDNNVLIALIGASSSGLVAITALILSYRGFSSIDSRFSSLEATVNTRFASVERRLDMMQADMKDLNKAMTALEVDVALVKDKVGL
jgi:hypothetical protein